MDFAGFWALSKNPFIGGGGFINIEMPFIE
jgi:hypothetical protein